MFGGGPVRIVSMSGDWSEIACRELAGLAGPDGAWGYRRGASACVEPTAMATLALLARGSGGMESTPAPVRRVAAWLASVQQANGSLGLSSTQPTPGWTTPYAVLVWRALGVNDDRAHRAAEWLLAQKGRTLSPGDDPDGVAGHDTTLVGWPWVADTHSWLEPTALAVLALGVVGWGAHPRVVEGLELIRNRAVVSGGWNYGNRAVFGRPLRAQPAPTGLALLALAGTGRRSWTIDHAITYLETTLPGVRAPVSLGWGLLGLRVWGVVPEGSRQWLGEAYAAVSGRPDVAPRIAPLILADTAGSERLFGRTACVRPAAPARAGVSSRNEAGDVER